MGQLKFNGQTVVVTGAGGGLGRAYATFFAARGANVVVNDLGCSYIGEGRGNQVADVVVEEIKRNGGNAVANYDSVENGRAIIETAINTFGRIDILINNSGILRDVSFKNIRDDDWDSVIKVHVNGAYKCTQAAWPYFRKQKYGRVINTTSASGLYGAFGQTNYSTAKLALVGFTESLAKEGAKYNILCNVIAPVAGSRMTQTVLPESLMNALKPEYIVPLVAVLAHESNTTESGSIFEVGGGCMAKLRWERSQGLLLRADSQSYTPSAILKKWNKVIDFSHPSYPTGPANFLELLNEAKELPENEQGQPISFKGRVALVTGGGNGLGRAYCHLLARYGAKVVVNDLVDPNRVVQEIVSMGGEAVGNKSNVEDGEQVVKTAIDKWGRIDILINNAGILRDKAFANMTDDLWDSVMRVHVRGSFKVSRAAWPYMVRQKYGRIVNTTSTSGIYGNFGQTNYSSAKCGLLGFTKALALEGAKYGILVNAIAPNAGTNMTRTIMPEEIVQALKPDFVAPFVVLLSSDKCPAKTGKVYEVGSGWQAETRLQRSKGYGFSIKQPITPELVLEKWHDVVDFSSNTDYPSSGQEAFQRILKNVSAESVNAKSSVDSQVKSHGSSSDVDYVSRIEAAKNSKANGTEFTYTEKDLILYNLGVGAKRDDLSLVYENDENFHVVSTFGVIPSFSAIPSYNIGNIVPNFSPAMLLHGEQYLEIRANSIPTSTTLVSYPRLVEILDKGKSAVVVQASLTKDKASGREIFYNESTLVLRGCGGFGGSSKSTVNRGLAAMDHKPPNRGPDVIIDEKTSADLAALYRLNGDYNPLHIDPNFARVAGFKQPILHGLCFFGIAGRIIETKFAPIKNIKVRFTSTVIPGQTLRTEIWRVKPNKLIFQMRLLDSHGQPLNNLCITNGGVELRSSDQHGQSKL